MMLNVFRWDPRRWWQFPLFHAVALVLFATGLRIFLLSAYGPPEGSGMAAGILARGFWMDGAVAALTVLPLASWCALRKKPWAGAGRKVLVGGVVLAWMVQAFLFVSEGFFFDEFLSRFNTVAIDYLIYPTEVVMNLWESYPLIRIVLACVAIAGLVTWLSLRVAPPVVREAATRGRRWRGALVCPEWRYSGRVP